MSNAIWELSPAYQQHYHERSCHVGALLEQWGSHTNSQWPDAARFVSITEIELTPQRVAELVMLGRAGVLRQIPDWRLHYLFPQRSWDAGTHDVYFIDTTMGNVRTTRAPSLTGYIVGSTYVRVVQLGCNHPTPTVTYSSTNYRRYTCPACAYTWGEDSSD